MAATNPIHQSAIEWEYEPFTIETANRIVAFGDCSGLCPTYRMRTPPCTNACPAGEDIRGYNNVLRGIWKFGDSKNPWEGAFYRLTQANPFPSVMGRVCPAPCQGGCNRQYRDETVGINAIEHAIGQYGIENRLAFKKPTVQSGKKVAVVGGGPGGLSCAYQLALRGHAVTIFERDPKLGGMMRYGIMGYRVDRQVMEQEIQRILDLGVEVRTNTKIGVNVTLEALRADYDAVFLAVGAQKGRGLPIPGAEGPMCTNAIDFLREFEIKGGQDNINAVTVGKHVVVIGDGDVAMDVARLGLRLGSKSTLLAAVAREDMNCSANEFAEAVHEGTEMRYQTGTLEVLRDGGKITGVRCIKMVKKAKGEEGWNHAIPFFRYKQEPGTEFVVECDMVVASIGQTTDMIGLEATTGNTPFFQVDHNFQIKGMPGVFGGGDAVKITLLTTAIGHGRKAAEAIELYLQGKELPKKADKVDVVKYEKLKWDYFIQNSQKKRQLVHPAVVKNNWDEILQALQQGDVIEEAKRCMSCGLCFECKQCEHYCPQHAITSYKGNPEGQVMFTMYERCVGCHICSEVCPTGFIDMGMQ